MKPPKQTSKSTFRMAWWKSPGLLYFFAAGNPPVAIKIGMAAVAKGDTFQEAIQRRFREIQTSNHEQIELLGVILFTDGDTPTRSAEVLERELHTKFASSQRFKQHTRAAEWFNPSDELFSYIKQNAQMPESLGVPRTIAILNK